MGLHGRQLSPTRGYNDTDVRVIDDISSGFNTSTTTFNLTDGGAVYRAFSEEQILVILGGIIQKPKTDYTINNTAATPTITFTTCLLYTSDAADEEDSVDSLISVLEQT